ncbi:MAG: MATE family efflux transporter, partial [Eubacteriales bacterium]|nr:MATE family efflux transporter [Eubacteriales bacterium]
MNRDLTTGSLGKQIVIFSLPYFLSYFLQMLYGLADMYITGQYNGAAVITAVSVGSQIMHLVTVVLVGVTMGTTVMIGRHVGGGNREEASKVAGNTFVFFILLSLALTVVMLALMDPIIKVLSVPSESVVETRAYLKICIIGIPAITMYNVISAVFRGTGDSRTPMYFIFIACVINIILDYVFIGPMGMRAAGAAYGTVLAQLISVICSLFVLLKKDIGLKLERPYFKPDKKTLKSMLSVGLPVAFQDGLIQVSFLIITTIANRRGVEIAAAVGIVEKIITFLFLVPSTLESTISTVSSHNIGAGKFDRAKKTLFIGGAAAVIYGFTVFVICQFISGWLVSMFTKDS